MHGETVKFVLILILFHLKIPVFNKIIERFAPKYDPIISRSSSKLKISSEIFTSLIRP